MRKVFALLLVVSLYVFPLATTSEAFGSMMPQIGGRSSAQKAVRAIAKCPVQTVETAAKAIVTIGAAKSIPATGVFGVAGTTAGAIATVKSANELAACIEKK